MVSEVGSLVSLCLFETSVVEQNPTTVQIVSVICIPSLKMNGFCAKGCLLECTQERTVVAVCR